MSFDAGLMIGMMLGRKGGSGGGDENAISGIIYTGGNFLKIVTKKDSVDTDNIFYLDIKSVSKSITTMSTKTSGETTTTTTSTRTLSKNIITALYNSQLQLLYSCDIDSDGNMTALYDGDGNTIDINEEVTADE